MSSAAFMGDLSAIRPATGSQETIARNSTNTKAGKSLEMSDFLTLMVASFQNQSIDDTASVSDMMNQMVQMSVVQAISNISSLITQSTSLSYAASLVGKEVTIGKYDGGQIQEFIGTVTGTGTQDGKQVVFIGDECFDLTEVMAVGRLPQTDGPAPIHIGVQESEPESEDGSVLPEQPLTAEDSTPETEPEETERTEAAEESAQPETQETAPDTQEQQELVIESGFVEPSVG